MNTPKVSSSLVEDEPKELRQAFGWLNPIFRTLSFLPLTLALFGMLGTTALIRQQQFQVSYHESTSETETPLWVGTVRHIRFINDDGYFLPDSLSTSDFSLRFRARLWIPTAGEHAFALDSDDASWLFLDGRQILDNGGRHRMLGRTATVLLEQGWHDLELDYRQYDLESVLMLRWARPEQDELELLRSPYVYLPETEVLPLSSLSVQRWFSFGGVVLLLVQLWSLAVIVFCFPKARAKMSARLALIALLGTLGGLGVLWSPSRPAPAGLWAMPAPTDACSLEETGFFKGLFSRRVSEGSILSSGPLTHAIFPFFTRFWGSPSAAASAVFLCAVLSFVGLQYRLGKDFFASKAAGIVASAFLAVVTAFMLREGITFAGESLVYGSLMLLFSWRICRQRSLWSEPMNPLLFILFTVLGFWTSWVVLCFFLSSLTMMALGRKWEASIVSLATFTSKALLVLAGVAVLLVALSMAFPAWRESSQLPTAFLVFALAIGHIGAGLIVKTS